MNDSNAPYRESIDRCQNCNENHYQDSLVAFDTTVGCAVCIKECDKCFKLIDTTADCYEKNQCKLHPAKISQLGHDGVDSEICQECAEEVIDNPDDFPDVKMREVVALRVEINRLKR